MKEKGLRILLIYNIFQLFTTLLQKKVFYKNRIDSVSKLKPQP